MKNCVVSCNSGASGGYGTHDKNCASSCADGQADDLSGRKLLTDGTALVLSALRGVVTGVQRSCGSKGGRCKAVEDGSEHLVVM